MLNNIYSTINKVSEHFIEYYMVQAPWDSSKNNKKVNR